MLRLLTLGGAVIVDESGDSLGAAASQRRTLALLSVLAVAGPVGMSRDKLVALFWPESDAERGRHALTQALYSARRVLRCDDLFVVNADVRLNDARMSTDVSDLEDALSSDPERAVSLYRGPFLDGFFLAGSAEFEQWCSTQRARIEAQIARAFEQLATAASAAGNSRQAAEWWKRLASLSPFDSGIAVRLMEALIAAGDRAGALNYATVHARLLRSELGLEPDPAVIALGQSLRDAARPSLVSETETALRAERNARLARQPITTNATGVADLADEGEIDAELSVENSRPNALPAAGPVEVWVARRHPSRRWRILLLLGLAAALVGTGIGIGRLRPRATPIQPLAQKQRVVVAPFRVAGASPSLAYLRDGIVELLSTRLADDSLARSVDAGAVIGAWRAAGLAPAMDVPRDTVVRLAARLGAERVVVGGVIGTEARLVVRATVLRIVDGSVAGQASVEGSADSITAVIDRLAARLLVAEAGEDERLANHMTSALPALRAYLAGQAAFRQNDYSASIHHYEDALARDSTFALAALHLAISADRVDDASRLRRGVSAAWGFREELGQRDRTLLLGFSGSRFPAPSLAREQVDDWRRLADLAPSAAESWLALGTRLFHQGATVEIPSTAERVRAALLRALAADTGYVPAARLLAHLTSGSDPENATVRAALRVALNDSLSPFAPFLRWHSAASRADSSALRTLHARLESLGPANLREIVLASQFDAIDLQGGRRALEVLRGRGPVRLRSADLLLATHAMALNEGRIRDAVQATADFHAAVPTSHVHLRLRVLDGLYGDGDTSESRAAARGLEAMNGTAIAQGSSASDTRLADLCAIGQWQLATGRTAAVPGIVAELRASGTRVIAAPVSVSPVACAELLDAAFAVEVRGRDARVRLLRLDSLAFTTETAADAALYAPLWIARLHERMGDRRAALRAIRRRPYMSDWPRYLATTLREEGRFAEANQDFSGAMDAYSRYLALRHHPEPELMSQATVVRGARDRLGTVSKR